MSLSAIKATRDEFAQDVQFIRRKGHGAMAVVTNVLEHCGALKIARAEAESESAKERAAQQSEQAAIARLEALQRRR